MCDALRGIPSGIHLVLSSIKNIMDHLSFESLLEDVLTRSLPGITYNDRDLDL
jgi:hypothetical protein